MKMFMLMSSTLTVEMSRSCNCNCNMSLYGGHDYTEQKQGEGVYSGGFACYYDLRVFKSL